MIKPEKRYTIKEMIIKCCREYEKSTAFEYDFGKGSITYGMLERHICGIISCMYERGYSSKKVAILTKNSYEYAVFILASLCSDMTLIPIDPSLNDEEIKHRISFCDADLILYEDESLIGKIKEDFPEKDFLKLHEVFNEATLKADSGYELMNDKISDDHVCLMLFSSGTGGKMKLAMITQINLFSEWNVIKTYDEVAGNGLIISPLFHILAIGDLIGNIYMGKSVYISIGFSNILKEMQYVKPKCLRMVPATAEWIFMLIKDKSKEEGRKILGDNLINIRTSGAPLDEKIINGLNRFDINVVSDYGMTELCGPVSVAVACGEKLVMSQGSSGHVIDGVEVLIDKKDGQDYGEILLGGLSVFIGYYNDEEATKECLKDGYFHTGDLGKVDEDGFLYIVGRSKNVIVLKSGENIIPEQIEKELTAYEYINECIIFEENGVLSVRIVLAQKDDDSEEKVRNYIKKYNRTNPVFKQIGSIYFVDELKRTGTGKVKR